VRYRSPWLRVRIENRHAILEVPDATRHASGSPEDVDARLPRHLVPTALIERLAVDLPAQEMGIGRMLLSDAIERTLAVSDDIATYATVVDDTSHQRARRVFLSALGLRSPLAWPTPIRACFYHWNPSDHVC